MAVLPIEVELDLSRNQILNPRFQLLATDPGSPIEGLYYWNTSLKVLRYYDGTGWRNVTKSHGDLDGLDQDQHQIYMHVSIGRTVTAVHTFAPSAPSPPFVLGANAINQLVVGFNADRLDGYDASSFAATVHSHNAADITDLIATIDARRLNYFTVPDTSVSMGGQKIVNLADPTLPTDAANKRYVDAARAGMDYKEAVRVLYKPSSSSVADSYLSNFTIPSVVDGVAMNTVGTRLLILTDYAGQKALQGIYSITSISSGVVNVQRTSDANTGTMTSGMTVGVTDGAAYRGTTWTLLTQDPIAPDNTSLLFTQIGGAGDTDGSNTANAGVQFFHSRVGNTLQFRTLLSEGGINLSYGNDPAAGSLYPDATVRISVNPAAINLNNLSGVLDVAKGGTGATTPAQARINLGAVGRITATLGNNVATEFTIPHQLGSRFVVVDVFENGPSFRKVLAAVTLTDNNNCKVSFNTPPSPNQFVALVHL